MGVLYLARKLGYGTREMMQDITAPRIALISCRAACNFKHRFGKHDVNALGGITYKFTKKSADANWGRWHNRG